MVQYEQEDKEPHSRASACKTGEREKERIFWRAVRRALFIAIQAIEERYDMPQTKAGR